MLGTYGRIYRSPDNELEREAIRAQGPPRKINLDVAAWRLGRLSVNPATRFHNIRIYEGEVWG